MDPDPISSCRSLPPPHFFTVVLQLNLDNNKLMIPMSFVTEYGHFLSSWLTLKLPDNTQWKLGLTTAANGTVWMQRGWKEFAQYYYLGFGSFLHYRFEGDSTFYTTIFSLNGSEIKYNARFEEAKPKTITRNPFFQMDMNFKISRNLVAIPAGFSKRYLSAEMHTAKLQVGDKQWEVKLKSYNCRFRLSAGWPAFYKDNFLEYTSSCLFEMVHIKKCVFKVTVSNRISSTSTDNDNDNEDEDEDEEN